MSVANDAYRLILRLLGPPLTRRGYPDLSAYPGLYAMEIDDDWCVQVNGHGWILDNVPPFGVRVSFKGLHAGLIDPGGVRLKGRRGCTEAALIKAVRSELQLDQVVIWEIEEKVHPLDQ